MTETHKTKKSKDCLDKNFQNVDETKYFISSVDKQSIKSDKKVKNRKSVFNIFKKKPKNKEV